MKIGKKKKRRRRRKRRKKRRRRRRRENMKEENRRIEIRPNRRKTSGELRIRKKKEMNQSTSWEPKTVIRRRRKLEVETTRKVWNLWRQMKKRKENMRRKERKAKRNWRLTSHYQQTKLECRNVAIVNLTILSNARVWGQCAKCRPSLIKMIQIKKQDILLIDRCDWSKNYVI